MNSLKIMPKHEKAHFLSMDLIERMIRVEQRVSASFNCPVMIKETRYYTSLSPQTRKSFDAYLRAKKTKKICFYGFFFGLLILISLFNLDLTGNAINTNVGFEIFTFSNIVLSIILAITVIIVVYSFFLNKTIENRFQEKVKIIDDFLLKKGTIRKRKPF